MTNKEQIITVDAKQISVIIPHYNGESILKDCLESLYKTTQLPIEIIVVDNGSSDNSVKMITDNFPKVTILKQKKNLGFAGGCNAGIKHAVTPFVLILNNDTVHTDNWIDHLLEKILSDDKICAVQPKLLSFQNQEYFDYSGACGGEMDIFGFPFARGRIFENIEKDENQYDDHSDEIVWASGTAFMARRELLVEAGMFDESFFAHMEEIDLDWRFRLMGYKIVVEPKSVIFHRSGWTLGAESPFKKYLNHRNSLIMFLANYSIPVLLYLLPLRILLDYMALGMSLMKFDFGRINAIFKAHFYILFHVKLIITKRKTAKKLRVINDSNIMKKYYKGSIAISSFVFRKKIIM